MTIFDLILITFMCLFFSFIGVLSWALIHAFVEYITTKKDTIQTMSVFVGLYLNTLTEKNKSNGRETLMMEKSTQGILDIIDDLVSIEISGILQRLVAIHKPYEFINLDKDIEEISSNVKNALNLNHIANMSTFISDEYLLRYIIIRTRDELIHKGKEYNLTLSLTVTKKDEA